MSFHHSVIEDTDALLIENIRRTSILYNNHYADFRHSHKKDKAWEEVANSVGISKSDAIRRWKCLRDRYSRELKEVRSKCPRKDDCGTGEFFQIMDFLRPFVRKRRPNKTKLLKLEDMDGKAKKLKANEIEADFQSEDCSTQDQYNDKEDTDEYNYIACEYPIETYEELTDVQENSGTELSVSGDQKNIKDTLIPIIFPTATISSSSTTEVQRTQTELAHALSHVQSCDSTDLKTQQNETEDDFFCKSVAIYLRKLSRLHKIKAKVEIFQILEKYIEIEEHSKLFPS